MKIDLTPYRNQIDTILEIYREKGLKRCVEISVASGYPLILVYTLLDAETGEFGTKIEELKRFYGYSEVIWA